LDVQADFLDDLELRVVVPLAREENLKNRNLRLHPTFVVEGRKVVMSTAEIVGMSKRHLGPKVGSLAEQRYDILGALDFIFTGI
jgi:toxin CcdB